MLLGFRFHQPLGQGDDRESPGRVARRSLGSLSPSEPTKPIANYSIPSDGCDWRMLVLGPNDCSGPAQVQRTQPLQTFYTSRRSPRHSPSTRFLTRHCLLSRTMAQWVSSWPPTEDDAEDMIAKFAKVGIDYDQLATDLQREGDRVICERLGRAACFNCVEERCIQSCRLGSCFCRGVDCRNVLKWRV